MPRDLFGQTIFEPIKGDQLPPSRRAIIESEKQAAIEDLRARTRAVLENQTNATAKAKADAVIAKKVAEAAREAEAAEVAKIAAPGEVKRAKRLKFRTIPPAGLPPKPRRSLANDVAANLNRAGVANVSVDEVKKSLFANAKLKAFHFVVYMANGPNLLLWCGRPNKAIRDDMAAWEKVFGEGYVAAYAFRRATAIVYELAGGWEVRP